MGDSNEHAESDRRRMEQPYHPCILAGVLGGSSAFCIGNGDTLVAEQVEAVVSLALCLNAVVGNADSGSRSGVHCLSVHYSRHAAFHLFPILICPALLFQQAGTPAHPDSEAI